MIYIIERFQLKPDVAAEPERVMQSLDDLVGPAAHEHPGWMAHAMFFQNVTDLSEVLMVYPWKSRELHSDLLKQEEPTLFSFYREFCSGPRRVELYRPLDVEVEHDKRTR